MVDWLVTVDSHLHRFDVLAGVYTIPMTITQAALVIAQWVAVKTHRPMRGQSRCQSKIEIQARAMPGQARTSAVIKDHQRR